MWFHDSAISWYFSSKMNMLASILHLSCLFLLISCSLAHRNGAEAESCYGHEILHPGDFNPNSNKQECNADTCRFELRLIDEVNANDFSQLLGARVAGNYNLTCGSVYRCESFLHSLVDRWSGGKGRGRK